MSAARVSIIAATRRPHFLANLVQSVNRQAFAPHDTVIVLHGFTADDISAQTRTLLEAGFDRVLARPASESLGACLNAAAEESRGDILIKMDDDDLYGASYVGEAVDVMAHSDASIVGKAEAYVYFAGERRLALLYPGASLQEQYGLFGGTLCFARPLWRQHPFADLSVGEDSAFLKAARESGHKIQSSSRRHYVIRRYAPDHHSWQDEDRLRKTSVTLRADVDDDVDELLRLTNTPPS